MRNALLVLAVAVLGVGCSTALPFEFRDGGVSQDAFVPTEDLTKAPPNAECATLNQAQCDARVDCAENTCPDCKGGQVFESCYDKGSPSSGVCPASCPAPCSSYSDETSCSAAGCMTLKNCCGVTSCADPGTPEPGCPNHCDSMCGALDESHCNADASCHALYAACGTSTSCNAKFTSCAEGAATCTSSGVMCNIAPPFCPNGYVPGIGASCWEGGCVKQAACCTPACSGNQTCEICFVGYSCLPEGAVC